MCGRETFEMLVSSNSMKVAIVTVSAIAQGLYAGLGEGSWSDAGATRAATRDALNAAISWAPPTFRDATDAPDPGRGRSRFAAADVGPPSRSCRWHSRPEAGRSDRRSRRADSSHSPGSCGRRYRYE